MRIIFLGSDPIGPHVLRLLAQSRHEVVAAVTEMGDGKTTPSIKKLCGQLNVKCLQYKKVCKEGLDDLRALKPDIFVVAAYGQILSEEFLQIAPTLNVHPSLLPKWRGATPIPAAILAGETLLGVSIIKMVRKLDAGPIIAQQKFEIAQNETAGEAYKKAAQIAAELVVNVIEQIENGTAVYKEQNDDAATFCTLIKKEQAQINFGMSAAQIVNFVRAYNPWPVAFTNYKEKQLKVFSAAISNEAARHNLQNGQILTTKSRIFAGCGNGEAIELLEVQLPGAKRLGAAAFLCGNKIEGFFK